MTNEATPYGIGTALSRAHDNDAPVKVLVEGEWICGQVIAVDDLGVVLSTLERCEHTVIRLGEVSAVTVGTRPPVRPAHAPIITLPTQRLSSD